MIKVGFPDGNEIKYDDGITPYEIAEKISPALAREILSACLLYTSPSPRDRG